MQYLPILLVQGDECAIVFANAAKPVEVSGLTMTATYHPHWTSWNAKSQRLFVTSGETPDDRTFLLELDPVTVPLSVDAALRQEDSQPGFSFAERKWPLGWTGVGMPHGAVITR